MNGCASLTKMLGSVFAALFAAALLIPVPASALVGCDVVHDDEPSGGAVYKVALDELSLPATFPDAQLLHEALRSKLQDNFDKLKLEIPDVRFRVLFCQGRRPLNPPDILFDVKVFAEKGVVLEVWGYFDGYEATFIQAVIPLLTDKVAGWPPVDQYYQDAFPYDPAVPQQTFLKRLVLESDGVRAYAFIGIASQALQTGEFDRARRFFCRAEIVLDEMQKADPADLPPALAGLREFASEMSLETIDQAVDARAAGGYSGVLGSPDEPAGKPCTEEMS
jgi:hypothetical protein